MAYKRITTLEESETGQNLKFRDNQTGGVMNRQELVKKIENGDYPNYHIRKINDLKTPVSNPDDTENNNLD
ncbi:MAG: hypothetical protein IH994_08995 [Proteobacteria bacterium]|nr:hypothetical protein [Pseudomonadota bacterium]